MSAPIPIEAAIRRGGVDSGTGEEALLDSSELLLGMLGDGSSSKCHNVLEVGEGEEELVIKTSCTVTKISQLHT